MGREVFSAPPCLFSLLFSENIKRHTCDLAILYAFFVSFFASFALFAYLCKQLHPYLIYKKETILHSVWG